MLPILLLCVMFAGAFASPPVTRTMSETGVKTIDYNQLKKYIDEKSIYLVDVREKKELEETGVLPNSVNVPCKYRRCSEFLKVLHNKYLKLSILFQWVKLSLRCSCLAKSTRKNTKLRNPLKTRQQCFPVNQAEGVGKPRKLL